jgi:hypothetical protein
MVHQTTLYMEFYYKLFTLTGCNWGNFSLRASVREERVGLMVRGVYAGSISNLANSTTLYNR